jgi:two-component system, chemotaxis family, protein-glutamate methylesterase/glutaminase
MEKDAMKEYDPQTLPTLPIRVLVVDDSALMRKMICEIIAAQPDMEVIGTAYDGEDALQKTRQWQPDVVSLDIEMPRVNGLQYLESMMQECPTRTLVVSSMTREGAEITLQCLERGAIDCLAKPAGATSLNIAAIGQELVSRLRTVAASRLRHKPVATGGDGPSVCTQRVLAPALPPMGESTTPLTSGRMGRKTVLVAIAASTGGPAALNEFLPLLPAELNAAYMLVQHLPTGFSRSLAERLNVTCRLTVCEAQKDEEPKRSMVYVAPGGVHLELDENGRIQFNEAPPLWGVRPAADVMMRSVATVHGARTIGVVLTGMGRDGAIGAKSIHQAGGVCFAQDEATCVVYGMPRAAVQSGAVLRTVALPEMAAAVARQIILMQAMDACSAA